ncbi:MAG: single-stranded DNA-binding protein [Candidatus Margulisiibacteriota bacterium]|nr:single-stranded DNA-binding protein [Candidatus Margulisiibacteriota bacterium]
MGNLNRAILTGRLTRDPEVRYTKNNNAVTSFSLAVNRGGKDTEADFINCVSWGKLAKICGEFLKKGRMVAVEGRIQVRKYETKDGQQRTATEIVASSMQMLDSKFHNASEKAEELVEV